MTATNSLFNAGTITSHVIGVRSGSSTSFIANVGIIGGTDTGVITKGALSNDGLIYGAVGVSLTGDAQFFQNSGTIQAISGDAVRLGGTSTFRNTGIVYGKVAATVTDTTDTVLNLGHIIGDVSLTTGADLYGGLLGFITGIVSLGGGNDTARGGAGDDTFDGGVGNDLLNGNGGDDTALFRVEVNHVIDLNITTKQNTGEGLDILRFIENVTTVGGADLITGNASDNVLLSGANNDTVIGGDGDDTLNGGAGKDTLIGGAGSDLVIYDGPDAVTVNLQTGTAAVGGITETVQDFEAVQTGAGNDRLDGNTLGNLLSSGDGNDTITAGIGNDTIDGGLGDDIIDGGDGFDTVVFTGTVGATADLRIAIGQVTGYGTDIFRAIENLRRVDGNDNFFGNFLDNFLFGNLGNDTLIGAAGNDTLIGGAGSDSLKGGIGEDIFLFDSTVGVDTIELILTDGDRIHLESDIFTQLNGGVLDEEEFHLIGSGVEETDDRIFYNQATGELFYDSNGSIGGTAGRFLIAVIENKPVGLTHAAFSVV